MQSFTKIVAFAFAVAFSTGIAANAMAETQWQKDHPRRTQVNHRLNNQNRRIDHKVADGQMTHAQAAALHKDDRQVRQEERDMASQDGSHITKQEDRTLNQQENQISGDIHHE
jgi:hypothetical protein